MTELKILFVSTLTIASPLVNVFLIPKLISLYTSFIKLFTAFPKLIIQPNLFVLSVLVQALMKVSLISGIVS